MIEINLCTKYECSDSVLRELEDASKHLRAAALCATETERGQVNLVGDLATLIGGVSQTVDSLINLVEEIDSHREKADALP